MSFHLDRAIELIKQAKEKGRLAHAYMLIGPPGSGKERLAMYMIEMTLQEGGAKKVEKLEDLKSSYVAVISPESKSRRITVDAIRSIEHTLQMAAPAGVTKFAVIRDADRMGPEASNAFLKTLEEPPPASRLLLLTSRPDQLLDTILSRCIRLPLAGKVIQPVVAVHVRTFFEAMEEHARGARKGLSGAMSLMQAFVTLLKQEKQIAEKASAAAKKAEVEQYRNTTDGSYLKQREDYWDALAVSEYLDRRQRLLEYLLVWFGDALRQRNGGKNLDLPEFAESTGALARQYDDTELLKRLAATEKLREDLATNVNEALALEVAFMNAFS